MEQIKTTTGTVRLVRNGVVMAERLYFYTSNGRDKDVIIERWKHTFGKKYWECELVIIDDKLGNVPVNDFKAI